MTDQEIEQDKGWRIESICDFEDPHWSQSRTKNLAIFLMKNKPISIGAHHFKEGGKNFLKLVFSHSVPFDEEKIWNV